MKKNIAYILLMTSAMLVPSCTEVLDRQPLDKISENNVWQDESMIRAYVTNLYSRFPFNAFEISNWYNITDEGTTSTGNNINGTNGSVSRSSELNPFWDYAYIRDCNLFLERIGATPLQDESRRQLEGEVRFIRAYLYFEMQKRYGGVPLVDIVLDPFSEIDRKYTARSGEEAVAQFIGTELDAAIALLSDNPLPKGRVNRWTALALKARASLWSASIARYGEKAQDGLTGIPADQAAAFYGKASQAATQIIESGVYTLYNKIPGDKSENYRKLFLDENNPEVIFEKPYDGVNIAHSWDGWHVPPQWAALRGGTGNPTLDFVMGFENIDGSTDQPGFGPPYALYDNGRGPFANKDPRLFATVFFQGDSWAGGTTQTYEGLDPSPAPSPAQIIRNPNTSYEQTPAVGPDSRNIAKDDLSTNSGFLIKKYIDDGATRIPEGQSKTNWITFRLAEMYLTKAEAEFELGNKAKAAEALNMTRERAGISLTTEAGISLEKIRTERRSELAFEGHRFWDLRRWRIAHLVLNRRFQGLQIILHYPTRKYYFIPFDCESFTRVFRQEHYYNPITTARIDNNPDLVENPLY